LVTRSMQRAMPRPPICLLFVIGVVFPSPPCAMADSSVAAVQKVVQMLTNMQATAMKEKQAEEVAFAEFKTWCTNEQASLESAIKKETSEIESLSAEVGKLGSDVKVLGQEIASLQQDVAKYSADLKAQKQQREKDHNAFLEEQKDYGESVDALERAIAILQKQNYDRTALLQLAESQQLPANAQQMVSAFLGMLGDEAEDPLAYASPEAHAYEFQSGSVVEMLKKLKSEFVEKKGECEKEEMNSRHAFDMLAQDLTSSVEMANEDISAKSLKKSAKQEESARLSKQLSSTEAVKKEDIQTLSDAKIECREKKESFEEKQQLRAEEIQALQQAIEILSREEVQGAAARHLALASTGAQNKAASLVQTLRGASASDSEGIRVRVRQFLESEGSRLHSKHLELLAQKLAADPFAKVKKMIDDMITRLLEEANSDADHEGFCDKELGESKLTRAKLSETIDTLTADIESGKAMITRLTQDIATLSKELADLEQSVKQATEMRVSEKAKNEATIKDAVEAEKALEAAMAVLKEFYAKASVATALVQLRQKTVTAMPTTEWGKSGGIKMNTEEWDAMANPNFEGRVDLGHKEGMQTFGETYQGQQDEAGGVMAMLEVILSDFAKLKSDTESSEALSSQTYNDFMAEAKKEKAVKSRKVELNTADKTSAEGKLRDDTADLKFTQDKLLAAERYYDKLKPQCIDVGMTYDERTKARADEIQSLKEALKILEGEDIAA